MAKTPTSPKPSQSDTAAPSDDAVVVPTKKRSKLLLFGAPAALLVVLGGGLWFSGVLSGLLGGHKPLHATGPVFVKVPEIVANLNVPAGQDSYAKLEATLELSPTASAAQVMRDMPRIIDVFQTYLRAMDPAELRGASGTYRLREALINRVRIAAAPNKIRNVLFEELIVQ
jgi:flagellar FliL protein